MAASATLEIVRGGRDSEKVADDSVDMASSMLKSYKQAAQALSDRHQTLGSAPSKTEDKSQHYLLIMVMAPLFNNLYLLLLSNQLCRNLDAVYLSQVCTRITSDFI